MDFSMKRLALALGLAAALIAAGACKKQQTDKDAIRAGILQHLSGVGGLNLGAMDMDIRSVTVNGNQAHAEVEFKPKGSGPQGAGMQVSYNLEKRDGAWVVQKTQPMGGGMQHPDPNQKPSQTTDVHSGSMPNFNDVLNTGGARAQGATPPPQQATAQPGGQDSTSYKKPR